jgi:hypothetical protein
VAACDTERAVTASPVEEEEGALQAVRRDVEVDARRPNALRMESERDFIDWFSEGVLRAWKRGDARSEGQSLERRNPGFGATQATPDRARSAASGYLL